MRKFLHFGLVSVFTLTGVIILGFVPFGLRATADMEVGQVANLTTQESTDSNAVEKDGARFELLVPERVLTIPPNQSDGYTPARFGLKITNKSQNPLQFSRFDTLTLLLRYPDGKVYRSGVQRRSGTPPTPEDEPILQPGESVTFFLEGALDRLDNRLQLIGPDGFGGYWYFYNAPSLKPGTYQVALLYRVYEGATPPFWTGWARTPFVEIRLVQP